MLQFRQMRNSSKIAHQTAKIILKKKTGIFNRLPRGNFYDRGDPNVPTKFVFDEKPLTKDRSIDFADRHYSEICFRCKSRRRENHS